MMKVVVNAYACCPGMGSEQGMGWNFVSGLAKAGCEVFVITESEHAFGVREKSLSPRPPQGEGALKTTEQWMERVHFYFVPVGDSEEESERIRRMCWNQGDWRFYHYYAKWQEKALEVAREVIGLNDNDNLNVNLNLDLNDNLNDNLNLNVNLNSNLNSNPNSNLNFEDDGIILHQLNMAGFREPGLLYKINEERVAMGKKPLPLVWGPMTGYGGIPFAFMKPGGLKFTAFYLVKNMLNTLQLVFHHRVRKMMKASDWVLATSPEMMHGIERYYGRQVERMNETGCRVMSDEGETLRYETDGVLRNGAAYGNDNDNGNDNENDNKGCCSTGAFRLLWVGRFMYTKQLPLALRTMKALREGGEELNIELHIVGKGFTDSETEKMHSMAKELGVDDMCRWHGFIPNEEVQRLMRECDVFFFTSIFEGTSTVMLEAIQNRLPVVCFDRCGFGPIVDEKIGRKIACSNPKQAVRDFAREITYLYNNRDVLTLMSRNCEEKIVSLSWDKKIERLMEIYKMIGS